MRISTERPGTTGAVPVTMSWIISLRVIMGVLCTINDANKYGFDCTASDAPAGKDSLTDGAYVDATFFNQTFPYLKTPLPGSTK